MEMVLGNILRTQRELQKITQEDLCLGICEPATLSKIENGKHTPRRATMVALLNRLGLVADRYYGLRNLEELKLENLKLEVKNANAQNDFKQALELIWQLEERFGGDDTPILKQFVLSERAINGRLVDGMVVHYTPLEQRNMLTEAILYTVPQFSIESIESLLLSLDELIIIENIANSYSKELCYWTANVIHSKLLCHIDKHLQSASEGSLISPLVTYNYSRCLWRESAFDECLKIAEIGIDCCGKYGKSRMLGELLINKSCALQGLGFEQEAMGTAIRSYYVLDAMKKRQDASTVRQHILDNYDIELY